MLTYRKHLLFRVLYFIFTSSPGLSASSNCWEVAECEHVYSMNQIIICRCQNVTSVYFTSIFNVNWGNLWLKIPHKATFHNLYGSTVTYSSYYSISSLKWRLCNFWKKNYHNRHFTNEKLNSKAIKSMFIFLIHSGVLLLQPYVVWYDQYLMVTNVS